MLARLAKSTPYGSGDARERNALQADRLPETSTSSEICAATKRMARLLFEVLQRPNETYLK
jgi:hypothetical protein